MDFAEVIKKRHSVRRFTQQPVEKEVLDTILDMAYTAPSSKNTKSSAFMVIDDPDTLLALSEMRDYGSALIKGAPVAVVVMGDTTKTDLWRENCAISATFIQLAATAMDLGSCWVHVNGRPRVRKDPSQGDAESYVKSLLGLKDEMQVLCVVAIGYEAMEE